MSVDFIDRRNERAVWENVVIGSVWEKRIKIDQVKGGMKVFFGGSDEELEEKIDAEGFGSDGFKASGRGHLSRKRKKWNRSDSFYRFRVSQPVAQAMSRTPDLARIKNTVAESDSQTVLCVESKVVCKNISVTDGIEGIRRNQVQETIQAQELGKNVVPVTKKEFRSMDKKMEHVDENIKIKMKKKFGSNEVYAAEQKLKKLMAVYKRRKSREVHSLGSKYQKSLAKSSEFHATLIRPASQHTKPSTNVSLPCFNTLKCNSVYILTWRDFPKLTLVFSVGTFIVVAESCVQVLNISFISAVSCLGLSYLAVMFTHRSLIHSEYTVVSSLDTPISEEEAIEMLKVTLPYINTFISALKSLLSGDPAMTLKAAVPLFILARYGGCISIWNIIVTGFFALFTVPKLYVSYSTWVTNNGENWFRKLIIAKKSCCKYKITIATISFVLVWNFCSTVTRIWALFMVFVATRCYLQQ